MINTSNYEVERPSPMTLNEDEVYERRWRGEVITKKC